MDTTSQGLQVIAALANRVCLQRFAEVVAGKGPAAPGNPKIDGILIGAGLFHAADDGRVSANSSVFQQLLASMRPDRSVPTGIDRFLIDGRLTVYPRKLQDRRLVFRTIAVRVFDGLGERSEKELNALLSTYTDDVARLRRAMIDEGLLQREPDGSVYRPVDWNSYGQQL